MVSRINHINIEDIKISYRTFSVLSRAGLHTVGEVIKMTEKQLLEINGLGVKCLEEIKREIFDEERVLEVAKEKSPLNTDDIFSIDEFSVRIKNALYRAGITTINELRETIDSKLMNIRNMGINSIAIINAVVPDRIRTYDGEADEIAAYRIKHKVDRNARRVLRLMETNNEKLSTVIKTAFRLADRRKTRQLLTDYCNAFPERIPDVLSVFESVGDTNDKFYISLKQAVSVN